MNKEDTFSAALGGQMDYEKMTEYIELLSERYPEMQVGYIGATILDKAIPVLTLGNPKASKSVMYLGGVGAGDSVTTAMLLRFVGDYFGFLQSGRRMYSVNLPYLFERRRIHIIPMLNCDGCNIRVHGCGENLLRDRLLSMNGGEESFGAWCSNARGVDLRRNYSVGFNNYKTEAIRGGMDSGGREGYCGTAPESEPESACLCNHLRINGTVSLLVNFSMDDNSLTYPCQDTPEGAVPRIRTVGRLLSRMSNTVPQKKTEPMGTAEDWFANEFRQPAFSLGCRYPDLENAPDDYIKIYAYLRETLFCAPLLV